MNPKKSRGVVTAHKDKGPGRWQRWGDHVAKHAWPYMLSTLALLIALTAPVLDLELGFLTKATFPKIAPHARRTTS